MDRFGSSKLRIVWVCISLLLTGLVVTGIKGISEDGSRLVIFGTGIPMGFDVKPYVTENLQRLIYTGVSATMLLGGFLPMMDWMGAGSRGERFKGLSLGLGLAVLHGLFLSQVAILPCLAAGWRALGNPLEPALLRADLNALLLGVQLLLWALLLGLLIRSNRGVAIMGAYAALAIGKVLAWFGEFGADLELGRGLVKTCTFLGHLLPTEKVPGDPFAPMALPLGLGGPLVLIALLLLLPGGKGSKAPRKSKA